MKTLNGFSYLALFGFEGTSLHNKKSGDYSIGVTPVPIPNTVVKPFSADDTWWEAAWESKSSPVFYLYRNNHYVNVFIVRPFCGPFFIAEISASLWYTILIKRSS